MNAPDTLSTLAPGAWKLLFKAFGAYLQDEKVTELLINRPGELWVLGRGALPEQIVIDMPARTLRDIFQLISNENAIILDEDNPILSGDLADGSRIELVIPPAAEHYTLSIRRHNPTVKRLSQYRDEGYFDSVRKASVQHTDPVEEKLKTLYNAENPYEFIVEAVKAKKNIVVAGGTHTGKTTLLNA